MIDFSEILDNVRSFYEEKKVLSILILVLIVLFFLSMIAFLCQSLNSDKQLPVPAQELPLVPDQKLLTPDGPSIPDGYALTREPEEKWSKTEAEEFFTVPDSAELKSLENANDRLVEEILGATP